MIKELFKKAKEDMCILQFPRLIDDTSMLPIDQFLRQEYKDNVDSPKDAKLAITLINCLLNQNAFYFILHRDNFREALKRDKLWNPAIGIDNNNWAMFVSCCIKLGLFKEYRKVINNKGRKIVIWETADPTLLSLLSDSDKNNQLDKIYKFIKTSDAAPDAGPDAIPDLDNKTSRQVENKKLENETIRNIAVQTDGIASLPLRPTPVDKTLTPPVVQAEPASIPANLPPNEWPDSPFEVSEGDKELVDRFLRKRS